MIDRKGVDPNKRRNREESAGVEEGK